MGQIIFKKAFPHILAVLTFLVLNIIYFYPQLEGKKISASDVVSNQGMVKEAVTFKEQTGRDILWTNSMFGGMPTYQIGGYKVSNLFDKVRYSTKLWFNDPIGVFFIANISFYILFLICGLSPGLSAIGAITFGLMTNNFVLWDTGHTNKLNVIATCSLVIAGVLAAYKRENILLGFVTFAFGFGFHLYWNHPQMTYYLFLCMLIYFVLIGIDYIKKGKVKTFGYATLALALAGVLAVGSSSSRLWTTYEYSKDTMRGQAILKSVSNTEATSSSETDGLAFNYAMGWSAGYLDLMNVLIPRSVGGSSAEKIGTNSALYQDLRRKGANLPKNFTAPMYWGSMSSTMGTYYVGALICFLFIFGLLILQRSISWWLGGSVLLTFLLALGDNFASFNGFLYNYLPLLNKFRAPSSILGVTSVFFCLTAFLTLHEILNTKEKDKLLKPLYIAGGITGGICLIFALMGGSLFDFAGQSDARLQQAGYDLAAIISDRKSLLRNDALRSLLFIVLGAGLIMAFIKNKLKTNYLLAGIGLLLIIDLWSVGQRYISADEFQTPRVNNQNFVPRPIDTQIMNAEKSRGHYRVMDMSIDVFNSSSTSYFHNTVGGYHPAKLQRIQDLINQHITQGNQQVYDMLNTKYFISQQGQLQANPNAAGTAWFVESITKVNSAEEEINALKNFIPANEAVVLDREFNNYISAFDPQKNGTISLVDYAPDQLTYTSNTTSEQLAVFSEIWYGPNKGWEAYVDGQPVEHIRANYALRAMKIPAGEHKIEFKFNPTSYKIGETISLASSALIMLLLLLFIGYKGKEFYSSAQEELALSSTVRKAKVSTKPKLKKTERKKPKKKKR